MDIIDKIESFIKDLKSKNGCARCLNKILNYIKELKGGN